MIVSTTEPHRHQTVPGRRFVSLVVLVLVALVASACNGIAVGRNIDGRLGDGTTTDRSTPVRIATTIPFDVVDAGDTHSCGISDGALYCWGSNVRGQLGTEVGSVPSNEPVRVGSDSDWTAISAGGDHTCGLRAPGRLFCWGGNSFGQVLPTAGATVTDPTRVGGLEIWLDVSAGQSHTCAIRVAFGDHRLSCWGFNGEGRLGNGTTTGTGHIFTAISSFGDWIDVEAGVHTCGRRSGGLLFCWGGNSHGQLGTGDIAPRTAPTRVGTATQWVDLGVGERHTCGMVDAGNQVLCWGRNANGQLGDGTTTDRKEPTPIVDSFAWRTLAVGGFHTCGVRDDQVACWGSNSFGALGDGTTADRTFPVPMDTDMTGVMLSAGRHHTIVIDIEDPS